MPYSSTRSPPHNHIRAVFTTSAVFFDMPQVATLEDLADRLCRLGEHHVGPLSWIEIGTQPSRLQDTVSILPNR